MNATEVVPTTDSGSAALAAARRAYVSVTHGMRGFFCVLLTWDEECGCHTPWTTGFGSFATSKEAHPEGRSWAAAEGIEFRP